MLTFTEPIIRAGCAELDADLVEFNGQAHHMHLLIASTPTQTISGLVPRLNGRTSYPVRRDHTGVCIRTRMLVYFIGGTLGTAFGAAAVGWFGWPATIAVVVGAIALAIITTIAARPAARFRLSPCPIQFWSRSTITSPSSRSTTPNAATP
jgi:hypothetical protein